MSDRPHDTEPPAGFFLLPWILAALLGLVAPWLLGGRAPQAYPVMTALAGLAALVAVLCVLADYRSWRVHAEYEARRGTGRPNPLRVFGTGLLRTLPLWFFIGFLYLGLSNPAYLREGNRLLLQDFNPSLPTVVDPSRSAPAIHFLASLLALLALLVNPALGARRRWLRVLLAVLLANALLLAWTGLYFRFLGNGQVLGRFPPRASYFFATFYYKNHWAAYALLYCGVAAAFFFRDLPRWFTHARQAGSGGLALVALLCLGLTFPVVESRSGILLFGLLGLVFAGSLFLSLPRGRGRALLAGAVLGGAGAYLFLTAADLDDEWRRTEQQLEKAETPLFDRIRVEHAPQVCLAMLADRPLTGWGYRSYDPLFPAYATDYFRGPDGALRVDMEFAHNDWLQHLAEFGLLGSGLLLLGLLLIPGLNPNLNLALTPLPTAHSGSEGLRLRLGLGLRVGLSFAYWMRIALLLLGLFALWDFPFSNPAVLASAVVLFLLARRAD